MQPLYSIVVGARSPARGRAGAKGRFSLKDLKLIERVVREEKGFEGFSMAKFSGFWMGAPEDCVEIRILSEDLGRVKACAERLRAAFKQDFVLLTYQGTGTFLAGR